MNALELADYMENDPRWHDASTWEKEAAAELRRLHAINAELVEALEAIEPFIPVTSAKEGGASKYSANVHAADKVREALQKVKQ